MCLGLAGLGHLNELDVSWNWVSNHECLHPLLTMSALQNLSLKGNPIYYHKGYKQNVAGYLHISASLSDVSLQFEIFLQLWIPQAFHFLSSY